MKINKNLINILSIVVLITLLYTSYQAIITFYQGYHDLDTAFNFLNLGYKADFSLSGEDMALRTAYISGLKNIKWGFQWMIFDVILALITGYLMRIERFIKIKDLKKV